MRSTADIGRVRRMQ